MENELIKIATNEEGKNIPVIDSREVAKMLGKEHKYVLRDIEGTESVVGIIPTLESANLHYQNYFIPSTYKAGTREYKCYLVTKMGCELLGNKQQGEKGILFTAKYVERFNQYEEQLKQTQQPQLPQTYLEALKSLVASEEERLRLEEEKKKLEDKNKEQEETIFLITNHSTTIEESRKVINALVRRISPYICKPYAQTWGELYTKFNYIQGININGRSKVKGEKSKLDRLTENELYKLEEVVRNWATELNIDIKEVLKLTSKEEE